KLNSRYFCSEFSQSLVDIFISPIDLFNIVNGGSTFCGKCCNQQRNSCTNIRAAHGSGFECGFKIMTDDGCPMRIAQDNFCPHIDEFVYKKQPAFKHFLMNQNTAAGLCGHHENNAEQIGGESRPGCIADSHNRSIDKTLNLITVFMFGNINVISFFLEGNS